MGVISIRVLGHIPIAAKEGRRMEWSTVLKAVERMRRIRTEKRCNLK